MALAVTEKTTSGSATDAASYASASITPTASTLILAWVHSAVGSGTPNAPTLSGNGLTWVQVATQTVAKRRTTLFRALGSSPSAGVVTFDFASQSQTCCLWSIVEVSGVDTSGTNGSGALVQSKTGSATGTTLTVTLDAAATAGNLSAAGCGKQVNEAFTVAAGWTDSAVGSASAPNSAIGSRWNTSGPQSVTFAWATGGLDAAAIIAEVKAAPVAPIEKSDSDSASLDETATSETIGSEVSITWAPSIIDATGRQVSGAADSNGVDQFFYSGSDVGGVHRAKVSDGLWRGFNSGIGNASGSYDADERHIAALGAWEGTAFALVGTNSGGAIKRRLAGTAEWTTLTTTYWGNGTNSDESGSIVNDHPRHTGRRIAVHDSVVWASVIRSASPRYGAVYSRDFGSTWSTFYYDATNDREFSALVVSPQYTSAGNVVLYGACRDTGGIYLWRAADTASPSRTRIDNGDGAPAFVGVMDMAVVKEGTKDVLYVVVGAEHSTSGERGVWRCVLTGDVSAGTHTVAWTQKSTGLPSSSSTASTSNNWWTSIVAHRGSVGGGSSSGDPQTAPVNSNVSGSIPVAFANPTYVGDPDAGWSEGWDPDAGAGTDAYDQKPPVQGRVETIFRHGNYTYIGGQFHRARTSTGAYNENVRHLCRVDKDTGVLDTTWLPDLVGPETNFESGVVRDITLLPDPDGSGDCLLIAGHFNKIASSVGAAYDTTHAKYLAAFRVSDSGGAAVNPPTLVTTLWTTAAGSNQVNINDYVYSASVDLQSSSKNIYLGGEFTQVNGSTRTHLAKLNLSGGTYSLDSTWTPTLDASDQKGGSDSTGENWWKWVSKIVAMPAHSRVLIGGCWTSINGRGASQEKYITAVDKTTGAVATWNTPINTGAGRIDAGGAVGLTSDFPLLDMLLVTEGATPYLYTAHDGTNLAQKYNATNGTRSWYWWTNGGVQAVGYLNGKVYFGFHGEMVKGSKNGTKTTVDQSRQGMFCVDSADDTLDPYGNASAAGNGPTFKSNGGNGNEGVLRVWAVHGYAHDTSHTSGNLYVGGDFLTVGGAGGDLSLPRFATFPASSSSSAETFLLLAHYGSTETVQAGVQIVTAYDGSTSNMVKTHWRSLDGGDTWAHITGAANVSTTVYGLDEEWTAMTEARAVGLNKSRVGGADYTTCQLVYEPVNQVVCSFGRAGTWRCDNPWASSPLWQPAVAGLGAINVRSIAVDPTNNLRVAISDIDRSVWRWQDGGEGQPDYNYGDSFSAGSNVYAISLHNGVMVAVSETDTYRNTNPWDTSDPIAGFSDTGTEPGTGEKLNTSLFTDSGGNTVWLVVVESGGLYKSTDNGATWVQRITAANLAPTGSTLSGGCWFAHKANSDKVWMFVGTSTVAEGGGLWYSSNAGTSWTRIWQKVVGSKLRIYGSIAQSGVDENTLWMTFKDNGVWKVTNAHDGTLNTDGSNATGSIVASKVALTDKTLGAIAADPTTGELVVCAPTTNTGGADLFIADPGGVNWQSQNEPLGTYPDMGYAPISVAKVGDRIYVALDGSGAIVGTLNTGSTVLIATADSDSSSLGDASGFDLDAETAGSDSAALSESPAINASTSDDAVLAESTEVQLAGADSASLAASGTLSVALTASDTLAFTDTESVAVGEPTQTIVSDTDAASLSVAATLTTTATHSDTSGISEATVLDTTAAASDSATLADTGTVSVEQATADSASLIDASTVDSSGTGTDTAQLDAAVSIAATASDAESGTFGDGGSVEVSTADQDAATFDSQYALLVSPADADSATLAEVENIGDPKAGSDSAALTDTGVVAVTFAATDSLSLADESTLTAAVTSSDAATVADASSSLVDPKTATDSFTMSEDGAVGVILARRARASTKRKLRITTTTRKVDVP